MVCSLIVISKPTAILNPHQPERVQPKSLIVRMMLVLREKDGQFGCREMRIILESGLGKVVPKCVSPLPCCFYARGWVKVDDSERLKKYASANTEIPLKTPLVKLRWL